MMNEWGGRGMGGSQPSEGGLAHPQAPNFSYPASGWPGTTIFLIYLCLLSSVDCRHKSPCPHKEIFLKGLMSRGKNGHKLKIK
jgi:hypothetical protein